MKKIKIVTIFDKNYASLGFSMIESANRNIKANVIFDVYPLSDFKLEIDSFAQENDLSINYSEDFFERADILSRKVGRGYSEFIFSLTPSILLNSLANQEDIDLLIYLDADTFFFHEVNLDIFLDNRSPIHLIPHQFNERNKHLNKYGRINVGWLSINPASNDSKLFLEWWEKLCIQSTSQASSMLEKGVFGDQLYLDNAYKTFDVDEIKFSRINVAPWNYDSYDGNHKKKIIMYHFHGLYKVGMRYFLPSIYFRRFTQKSEKILYRNYIKIIESIQLKYSLPQSLQNARRGKSNLLKLILFIFGETMVNEK